MGYDLDTIRWTGQRSPNLPATRVMRIAEQPPIKDYAREAANLGCRIPDVLAFGSAHPGGFHMAYCDGSVHLQNFAINPHVHRLAGHRGDGAVTGELE